MQMSDCVADHTADRIYAHMLRCQGVDRFRHWDASQRPALTRDFLRQQPEGSLYGLSDRLIATIKDPASYL